eukprot:5319644-Prymnesium_polylepis.3
MISSHNRVDTRTMPEQQCYHAGLAVHGRQREESVEGAPVRSYLRRASRYPRLMMRRAGMTRRQWNYWSVDGQLREGRLDTFHMAVGDSGKQRNAHLYGHVADNLADELWPFRR